MDLSKIVNIVIKLASSVVSVQGFGRALITGMSNRLGAGVFKLYSDPAAMLVDGFLVGDPEYLAALSLTSQPNNKPVDWLVANRQPVVTQIATGTVGALLNHVYTVAINGGVAYSYNPGGVPASKSVVANALQALIAADPLAMVVATVGGVAPNETLVLTDRYPGTGFTAVAGADLVFVATAANYGQANDLTAMSLLAGGLDWFALISTAHTDGDILGSAQWIEGQGGLKIFGAVSASTAVRDNTAGNVSAVLNSRGYLQTFVFFSGNAGAYPEAGLFANTLPRPAGSVNYALQTITGVTPDALTTAQITSLEATKANYYVSVGGNSVFYPGSVASGQWIDVVITKAWTYVTMQAAVFSAQLQAQQLVGKIPFTDSGIGILANAALGVLQQGVRLGLFVDGTQVVNQPSAASFTSQQRQGRSLAPNPITFSAQLAGAINGVTINGAIFP